MNAPVKLAGFVAGLVLLFGGAYAAGAVVGPSAGADSAGHVNAEGGHASDDTAVSPPAGLAVSADGYTLHRERGELSAGQPSEFAFRIVDGAGSPVTRYQTSHDKQLHLIVVRRDLTGFQHLHPRLGQDGTWRTPLTVPSAGDWRVFADFLPEGRDRSVILGIDVAVAGDYQPRALPQPAGTATVDGYTVRLDGQLTAGRISRLTLTVNRDGAAVTDLETYLGAYGHLVTLRAGDLAYLHVHPQRTDSSGPVISFDAEVPTAGVYALFLDFAHRGTVHTAAFSATA